MSLLRQVRAPLDTIGTNSAASLCAASIDAIASNAEKRPDAPAALALLDSLMLDGEPQFDRFLGFGHGVVANLIISWLREARGETTEALAAVRRRPRMGYGSNVYLSTYLREEGRLAALAGDTAGAIKAYSPYLALRYDPEPSLKPELDRIRREVARLRGDRRN